MDVARRPAANDQLPAWRNFKLALGPALAVLVILLSPGDEPGVARMAAVAVWMAAWWVTEAVPIPVTAMLPLILMPLLGIMPMKSVAPNYARSVIYLFLGGFLLALGLQRSGVHRRIALSIVGAVGSQPRRIVLGFMLASAALSMWISNTATTEMVLPNLASAGVALQTDPRYLMIPATLSASCAFMMPVASPTQAIVFGSGWVPIRDMIRAGIWLNIVGVILVATVFTLLSGGIMGIDPSVVPAWAK